jgi:inorganic pyrophosphatase/exopolyphosphatase
LVDSSNFSSSINWQKLDKDEFEAITEDLADFDKEKLYNDVIAARFDITGLSAIELLLKDAKFIKCKNNKSIFASTLHMDLIDFFKMESIWDEIENFYQNPECHNADLLLFLGQASSGRNRGIGWYGPKIGLDFSQKFREWQDNTTEFTMGEYENCPKMVPESGCRSIMGSSGKVMSRKKALPLMLPWFESNF